MNFQTYDGKVVGSVFVGDTGIHKVIEVGDYGEYICEDIIPRSVFVEAYKKYILEEAKNIGEIRINIPDNEKEKIIEAVRKELPPIVNIAEEDRATWITDEHGRKICSKCQFPFSEFQSHNYCSLCGRRMIGGTD